jgi:hypothetical protein
MDRDPTTNPFDLARLMAAWSQAFSAFATGTSAGSSSTSPADEAAMRDRMLELHLAVVNSGYRYLGRWAEISAKRYPEVARALASTGSEAEAGRTLGATLDSIRAFMREMAELPLDESKRLQTEIEAILRVGQPASGSTKSRPTRRARAKE